MTVGPSPNPRPNAGPDVPRCRDLDPATRGLRPENVGAVLADDGFDARTCLADQGYDDLKAWRDLAAQVTGVADARVALDPSQPAAERLGHAALAVAGIVPLDRAIVALPRLAKAVELAGADRVLEAARGGGRTDMVSHEVLGGHTIAKHVGAPRDLRERLDATPGLKAASSYGSIAVADRVLRDTLKAERAKVKQWLASTSDKPLELNAKMQYTTGHVSPRGGQSFRHERGDHHPRQRLRRCRRLLRADVIPGQEMNMESQIEFKRRYSDLSQFFGCYLNQGFDYIYGGVDQAIAKFIEEATFAERESVVVQLRMLLSEVRSDDDLSARSSSLGLDVNGGVYKSISERAWLMEVAATIERAKSLR